MVPALVLSCEHGGRQVPRAYRRLFAGRGRLLASHRGWDPGAAELAAAFARVLALQPVVATTTRLLVDLNRSPDNPGRWSVITAGLPEAARARIDREYHAPHRRAVERACRRAIARRGSVVHLSLHTFTPVRRGEVRRLDVGVLFDPQRAGEARLARRWKGLIEARLAVFGGMRPARLNEPYQGTDDGLTTWLRPRLGARYAGLELEVNQRLFRRRSRRLPLVLEALAASFAEAVGARAPILSCPF
ncbi:MAG: N-formylglutamate amidohydrolase [Phycisphaerales bacterium]|nr:N-formylglutamate amidohydrolase [Phycisphaerales bacterium]